MQIPTPPVQLRLLLGVACLAAWYPTAAFPQSQTTITVKVFRQVDGAPMSNVQVCLGNGDTSNPSNFAAYGFRTTSSTGVALFENVAITTYWTYATAVKSGFISTRSQFNPGGATTAEVVIRMPEGSGGYGCPAGNAPAPRPALPAGPLNPIGAPVSSGVGPAAGEGQVKIVVTVSDATTITNRPVLPGAQVCIGTGGNGYDDYAKTKTTDSEGKAWFIVPDVNFPNTSHWSITASKQGFQGTRGEYYLNTSRVGRYGITPMSLMPGSGGARCPVAMPMLHRQ
ncbi:MAG TPA: hypothetical protein VM099_06560 [Gemmatimonadaceae bacterium]|nr:hypothetical protein [Gemmatimonadaceae bacterium]